VALFSLTHGPSRCFSVPIHGTCLHRNRGKANIFPTRRRVPRSLWRGWLKQGCIGMPGQCVKEREHAPQSKWGRHCCRPHSHRRVGVFSLVSLQQAGLPPFPRHTWRPMSVTFRGQSSKSCPRALLFGAPRRAPSASGFVTSARAGIRHPLSQVSTPLLSRNLAWALRSFPRSRDCSLIRFSISNGRLWFAPLAPSIAIQARSLSRFQYFALISGDPPCFGPRPWA